MTTAPITTTARPGHLGQARRSLSEWRALALSWISMMLLAVRRGISAVRHHRLLFLAVAVLDGMVLAAIGNTYFYYKQPELVASVGPMWNPEVQKYLFVMQVIGFATLLITVRGVRALWRRRA